MDLSVLFKRNLRITIILFAIVAITTPIMYHTIDLPSAIYAKHELSKTVIKVFRATDDFDDYIIIALVASALFAILKRKNRDRFQRFAFPPAAALTSGIATLLLKSLFGRWRPKGYFKFDEYGFEFFEFAKSIKASYPSGHSSSIMAIMAAIAILAPKYRIPCILIACILASSRVIVSAHYPSDVVAGLALGYVSTVWLQYVLLKKEWLPADLAPQPIPKEL